MTLDEELELIRRNRTPAPASALDSLSQSFQTAIRPAAAAAPAPDSTDGPQAVVDAAPAAPPPDDPAAAVPDIAAAPARDVDAEMGLPAPEAGLEALPDADAGFWDVAGASWQAETVKTDAWNYTERLRRDATTDIWSRLPADARQRIADIKWDQTNNWMKLEDLVVAEAAKAASASPEAAADFAGVPLTREAFEATITGQRKAALAEAEGVLDTSDRWFAEFAGAGARAMTDQTSLMLLPFGVSGSAWRMIAGEALLGAAGEAAVLPREFQVADELGLSDPDPMSRILLGAALGGGLSAGILGIAKGISHLRARRNGVTAATPEGVDPLDAEIAVEEAEARMRGDQTVAEAVGRSKADAGGLGSSLAGTDATAAGDFNEAAVLRAIIGVESGGRADAQAATSSARGLGQFISSTWMAMIRTHRPDLLEGRTANEVLALRDDPQLNAQMTLQFMRDNRTALQSQGLPAGPGETYLAHFMGVGGAARALRAPLETPISQLMDAKSIAANRGIKYNGKSFANFTVYDLRQWANRKMRGASDPNASADMPVYSGGTSRGYTGSGQMSAGEKYTIDVAYEVVDASSLIRASGDLQPRDRSRGASDAWIADTAARLDPAQLMRSPTADRGAPLVGPDDMIESGNGRYGAILRAYELHPDRAAAYRAQIEAEGFAIPEGIERPVLVARRTSALTDAERRDLVVVAQDSGVAAMSATELAAIFGRAMTSPTLAKLDPTQPLSAEANTAFVRAAIDRLPRSMRGGLYDAAKRLSKAGVTQLKEALFARAWPDPDIIARYSETEAGELKSLLDALEAAAPNWAALRNDIEAGLVNPAMDISPFVLDAMRLIGAARDLSAKDKLPLSKAMEDLLNDVDLIEGVLAPLTTGLVRKFWRNGRAAPADEIASFLRRYADDARKAGAKSAMFDAPTPRDVLVAIDGPGFGSLPADLGTARGYARPGQGVPVGARGDLPPQALPEEGFDSGATSPEALAVQAEIEGELRAGVQSDGPQTTEEELQALFEAPDVAAAYQQMVSLPPTTSAPGYGTDAFWQQRRYVDAAGSEIVGFEAAVEYLKNSSRNLAWAEDGLPPVPVRSERQATILIGPPASGKSTVANPLARARGAAIVDADEAKKLIPEYGKGDGANAVHEESGEIADSVLEDFLVAGTNVVLPKVGGRATSIQRTIERLRAAGYQVELIEVVAPPKVALARMAARFKATGRLIPPHIMAEGIDGAPETYKLLKEQGGADAYARIDNAPGRGEPRRILEDDSDILSAVTGSDGSNRAASARTLDGASEAQAGSLEEQVSPASEAAPIPTEPSARADLSSPDQSIDMAAAELAGMRDTFADFDIDLPDGTTARLSDVLADLDDDTGFDAFLQACAITPTGGV